jgi:hypothetical protein
MRNFAEIPGGKSNRFPTRKDGNQDRYEDHEESFFKGDRQQDKRRERRESRQLMRSICAGGYDPNED